MRQGSVSEAVRLRIYFRISDRSGRESLHLALVRKAKELGLLGASVFPGFQGFGKRREITTVRPDPWTGDAPLMLEIVDDPEAIRRFMPAAKELCPEAPLVTSSVHIVRRPEKGETYSPSV